MKRTTRYSRLLGSALLASTMLAGHMTAWGQEATEPAAEPADETVAAAGPQEAGPSPEPQAAGRRDIIIVTGTRTEGRSVIDSPVPVDVLSEAALSEVAFTDTHDVLKTLVPSYTIARQPISDGATFIRPASLRGLSSDKTLVLVNSKRRHRAALVSIGGSGTQGPDVATIPATALKAVEVLRDGAAAQYGSDAIAGVINFILKDAPDGGEIQVQTGQYYEGDGDDFMLSANIGVPLGPDGFINISVEGTSSQPTNRGDQWRNAANGGASAFDVATYVATYPQYAYLFGSGQPFDTSNVQLWGQPEAEAFRSFVNFGYSFGDALELYGFANYSNSQSDGDFNFRFPDPEFEATSGQNNAGANPNGANGTTGPQIRLPDGSLYSITGRFPAGYTPRFFGNVVDKSITAGLRGDITESLSYDLSARYGKNVIAYMLRQTTNPSLGPGTPTEMKPGDLISDEMAVNADFVYSMPLSFLASPLNIGFGLEYRDEGYEIVQGDEAAWIAGPYAVQDPWDLCTNEATVASRTPTVAGAAVIAGGSSLNCASAFDPVYNQMGVGSDGFPGYSPDYSGSFNRDSYAAYVDFEADITDSLLFNVALRYENFSDFGETVDGKISGRWTVFDGFNIRGSAGTGFRAPTPGQLSTINVSTRFPAGEPVAVGLFPATNPVSIFLGAKPLEPEKSVNYTLGATTSLAGFDVTVDLYKIEISDQFYSTATITVTDAIRAQLLAANVPGADTIGGVNFFQNAFDAEASGVDVVVSYDIDWDDGSSTAFTLSGNYNKYEIKNVNIPGLFLEEDIFDFENYLPEIRGVFSVKQSIGPWSFMGRANYYGKSAVSNLLGGVLLKQELGEEVLFDIEGSYSVNDSTTITIGVRNVTDEYPDKADHTLAESGNGRIYRSDSVVDWQGGFYYGKIRYAF